MTKKIYASLVLLWVFGAYCLPQDTFWSDPNVAERMKASLREKGYSRYSVPDLVWVLHQENPLVAVPAAYLLGQISQEKELAERELVNELELWRDPLLARYIGGALNNLGYQSWTKIAVERLDSLEASDSVNIALEMARAKDYRGWNYVKKVLLDASTSDIKFRETATACRLFEMMNTGEGRRHSLAAELEQVRVLLPEQRQHPIQEAIDYVQGDRWLGSPNRDRLPTLPEKN